MVSYHDCTQLTAIGSRIIPPGLLRIYTTKQKVYLVFIGHSVQEYRTKRMAAQQHKSVFTVTALQRNKVSKEFKMFAHLPQLPAAHRITRLAQRQLPVLITYTVLLTNSKKKENCKPRNLLVMIRVPSNIQPLAHYLLDTPRWDGIHLFPAWIQVAQPHCHQAVHGAWDQLGHKGGSRKRWKQSRIPCHVPCQHFSALK